MNCSIAKALEVIGDRWTLLIIRDGLAGITRFDEIRSRLGIARNVLASRLDHLVDHGVITRIAYQDHPVRYDYSLTEKGRELWVLLMVARQWGDRWEAKAGPPVISHHSDCDHDMELIPTCSHCGATLEVDSVLRYPGPGAAARPAAELAGVTHS